MQVAAAAIETTRRQCARRSEDMAALLGELEQVRKMFKVLCARGDEAIESSLFVARWAEAQSRGPAGGGSDRAAAAA